MRPLPELLVAHLKYGKDWLELGHLLVHPKKTDAMPMAGPLSRKYLAAEKKVLLIRPRVVGKISMPKVSRPKKDDSSTFISHMIYKTPF